MQQTTVTGPVRSFVVAVDRFALWVSRHWLGLFIVIYGAWVLTPFLAPVLMQTGATDAAHGLYFFYSFFCHQLPERSLFFFGAQPMYSFAQIKQVWPYDGFEGLRGFIGNPAMGYKMAWSDRMVSFYGGLWLGGVLFAFLRYRLKSLPTVVWLSIGILPVAVDGLSHMLNDVLAGTTGTGFRDTNAWLQVLTGNLFPQWFYVGDALGSFNSDIRWITGILFGLASIWFLFPFIQEQMRQVEEQAADTLAHAGLK